ncbi:MAG: O-antigen ligase family protein [Oscillospiraceae bacterium]|nr:O-antigen ligase family protein [Oscillospiraceae bacterium]
MENNITIVDTKKNNNIIHSYAFITAIIMCINSYVVFATGTVYIIIKILLAICLFISFLAKNKIEYIKFKPFHFALLCYLFYTISIAIADIWIGYFITIFVFIIIFLIITSINFNKEEIIFIINFLHIVCIVFSFIIIISNPLIGTRLNRTAINFLTNTANANMISYFVSIGAVISWIKLLNKTNLLRDVFSLIIFLYVLLLVASRGGFLCFLVGSICIFLTRWKLNKLKFVIICLAIFIISLIIISNVNIIIKYVPMARRILIFDTYSDSNGRMDIWNNVFSNMTRTELIFGSGHVRISDITTTGLGAHNWYINILFSFGIIGLIFFVFFVIIVGFNFSIYSSWFSMAFLSINIINSMVEESEYIFWPTLILAVIIGKCSKKNDEILPYI